MKSIDTMVEGLQDHNPVILSRAITLVESTLPSDRIMAGHLIKAVFPYTGNSLRIAISGIPGSGKSTLINVLGLHMIEQGHKVAVLAVDPSSSISGGSILGDKTRMEELSKSRQAFIRPTPSAGFHGGVAGKTREAVLLCEAAGFDIIVIETLGVGQGEMDVRNMVDFFLLLQIAGLGDELQDIKKGIIEVSDAILINKADGMGKKQALQLKKELQILSKYMWSSDREINRNILTASALNNEGIIELWQAISTYLQQLKSSGRFTKNRKNQQQLWMNSLINASIDTLIKDNVKIRSAIVNLERKVLNEEILATEAAELVIKLLEEMINPD